METPQNLYLTGPEADLILQLLGDESDDHAVASGRIALILSIRLKIAPIAALPD